MGSGAVILGVVMRGAKLYLGSGLSYTHGLGVKIKLFLRVV